MWYSKEYNPIQVGSIDGTDIDPHDYAVVRATLSSYKPPRNLKTDPNCTLFISRLNFDTTEQTIHAYFQQYGEITSIDLVRNNVTGLSQGYAFITFKDIKAAQETYKDAHETTLDDHVILVDYERDRTMKGWIPRRMGGGYGGKKESGQLRFGARDRPFRRPPNNSDIDVDYDQKRSDCWKEQGSSSKRSSRQNSRSSISRSSSKHRRSASRDRQRHTSSSRRDDRKRSRSPVRDIRHHKSTSRERRHGNRSPRRDYRRDRSDSRNKRRRRSRSRDRHHHDEYGDKYHRSSDYSKIKRHDEVDDKEGYSKRSRREERHHY